MTLNCEDWRELDKGNSILVVVDPVTIDLTSTPDSPPQNEKVAYGHVVSVFV